VGESAELGGKLYTVNLGCLDEADLNELVNAPVTYWDGRHDNFTSRHRPPKPGIFDLHLH
jgi:hypothetical protein